MIDMGVSKVEVNGKTIVDLTNDTVTPETLLEGVTAHDMAGERITGTKVVKTEQTKSFEATANGDFTILPDDGKVLSGVSVNVAVSNADTVDGLHLSVVDSVPTVDNRNIITFVVG